MEPGIKLISVEHNSAFCTPLYTKRLILLKIKLLKVNRHCRTRLVPYIKAKVHNNYYNKTISVTKLLIRMNLT